MISVKEDLIPIKKRFAQQYNLKAALASLHNPQTALKAINVVGTNGKGSVSWYLSLGLSQKYAKVGLFTSPAFLYQNERIMINHEPISDTDLRAYLAKINGLIETYQLTFFEIWTLMAILYFVDQQVDYVVIEAGIGGVRDATYLFSNQVATLLTMVGLDHIEVLGPTVKDILTNKVLMAKPQTKLYISHDNLVYQSLIQPIVDQQAIVPIYTGLVDDEVVYQQANKGLVRDFLSQEFSYTDFSFLKTPPLNGRFQILSASTQPLFLIDGAHNPPGIKALIKSFQVRFKTLQPIVLVGCSAHKDYQTNLKLLGEHFSHLYVTSFDHHQAWDLNQVNIGEKISDWPAFLTQQINAHQPILVCGSLYFIPLVEEWYNQFIQQRSGD